MTTAMQRLGELADRDGKLTAESVLADAVDPDSPLHNHLEWDDAQAGHAHRLEQCRSLIRRYRLKVESKPTKPTQKPKVVIARGLVHVPSADSYVPLGEVMSDEAMRAEHVAQLKRRLAALRAELRLFEEFNDVVYAIGAIVDEESEAA